MVNTFKLPAWDEIPNIDLYLDQVISLIDGYFEGVFPASEPVLTKTMVNNYVKHQVIEPPFKKKYSKNSVCSLIAICVLKTVFSIGDIAVLLRSAIKKGNEEQTYTQFCRCIESAVQCAYSGQHFDEVYTDADYPYLLQNMAQSVAGKLYVLRYTATLEE